VQDLFIATDLEHHASLLVHWGSAFVLTIDSRWCNYARAETPLWIVGN